MGVAERSRRRVLVVDEALQGRIIVGVALVPTLGLIACALVVAVFCSDLLREAALHAVELPSLVPLFLALLGFMLAAGAVLVFQALRFSHRIAGPAWRLVQSLRRIRTGDISFRVHVRRGDHLTGVVAELNRLLDWLNANPPAGARTGSDLVQVASENDVAEERAAEAAEAELECAAK